MNILSRIGEYRMDRSGRRRTGRLFFQNKTMRAVAARSAQQGTSTVFARPLLGAAFDILVEIYEARLVRRGLIRQELADRSTHATAQGHPAIRREFAAQFKAQSRRIRGGAPRGDRRLRAAAGGGVADGSPHRGHVLASRLEYRRRRRAVESRPLRSDHPARASRGRQIAVRSRALVRARLLLTGAGSAATSNLIRSLRAGYRALTVVGCHSDRFLLKKSSADRNYLVPALAHPGYFGRCAA